MRRAAALVLVVTAACRSGGAAACWHEVAMRVDFGGDGVPDLVRSGEGTADVAAADYFVQGSSFAWFEHTSGTSFVRHEAPTDGYENNAVCEYSRARAQ